jgi:hypothetical protein
METTEKKSTNSGYKFIIFVLLIALGGLVFWYVREAAQWEDTNRQIEVERDSISLRLDDMLQSYDNMKTSNDALQVELEGEKAKIKGLLDKMRSKETLHFADIRNYEKEANTLRSIMRHYIHQIDSLNTLSQKLLAENRVVKQNLQTTREQNQKLEEEKKQLSSQVEKGAVIKVRDVMAEGLNSRDKDTKYASRTRKLKACFTINENVMTTAGTRFVYLCISDPSKKILSNADGETFESRDGERIAFAAKREVDYQNQDLETCIYYDTQKAKMAKGAYSIEIYIDGYLSGSGQMSLK